MRSSGARSIRPSTRASMPTSLARTRCGTRSPPERDTSTNGTRRRSTFASRRTSIRRLQAASAEISGARALAIFDDSITTDHISPAGAIQPASPAGHYLRDRGVRRPDFNSYGARRGNHEVMVRGTFANVRIRNLMVPGVEGGVTLHQPDGERMSIYDAAERYRAEGVPADRARRTGLRSGQLARLGCQGHPPARRARRDRSVVSSGSTDPT